MTDITKDQNTAPNTPAVFTAISILLSPTALKQTGTIAGSLFKDGKQDITQTQIDAAIKKIAGVMADDFDAADGKAPNCEIEKSVLVAKIGALSAMMGATKTPQELRQMLDRKYGGPEVETIPNDEAQAQLASILKDVTKPLLKAIDPNGDGVSTVTERKTGIVSFFNTQIGQDELMKLPPMKGGTKKDAGQQIAPK